MNYLLDTFKVNYMGKYLDKEGVTTLWNKIKDRLVPVPDKDGKILISKNGKGTWGDFDATDILSYGVSWKPNVADPVLTRVGNVTYHKTLPIQSGMKGCIYNPKEKKVIYWLNNNDWRYVDNPTKIEGTYEDVSVVDSSASESGTALRLSSNIVSKLSQKDLNRIKAPGTYLKIHDVDYYLFKVLGSKTYDTGVVEVYIKRVETLGMGSEQSQDKSVEIHSNLSGYDGEVMVYVPEFWIRSWDEADRREVRISPMKIDDTWEHQPAVFIGAYRDTVLNTVPENMGYLSTLEVNTAISVANDATYCRGGGNRAANDTLEDIYRRDLGKCRTAIARATFRTYARKAGKEIMSYRQYKNIMYWLWVIEYANFNSQATYKPELTAEGFHQGGMGPGLTTMGNWLEYNNYYAIAPNGFTNEFGNGTGVKDLVIPEFTYGAESTVRPTQTLKSVRWRGIEDPFGHIWHNVDGIIIDADADNHPDNMNYVYTTDDPSKYGDAVADIANMVLSGLEVHAEGYTKEWDLGTTAEIIPRLMGGTTTQYKCDYHYTGEKNTALRALLLGGSAASGGHAGLGYFVSASGVGVSFATVGFRTSCAAN